MGAQTPPVVGTPPTTSEGSGGGGSPEGAWDAWAVQGFRVDEHGFVHTRNGRPVPPVTLPDLRAEYGLPDVLLAAKAAAQRTRSAD